MPNSGFVTILLSYYYYYGLFGAVQVRMIAMWVLH